MIITKLISMRRMIMSFKESLKTAAIRGYQKVAVPVNAKYLNYRDEQAELKRISEEEKQKAKKLGKEKKIERHRESERKHYEDKYGVSVPELKQPSKKEPERQDTPRKKSQSNKRKTRTSRTYSRPTQTRKEAPAKRRQQPKTRAKPKTVRTGGLKKIEYPESNGNNFADPYANMLDPFR